MATSSQARLTELSSHGPISTTCSSMVRRPPCALMVLLPYRRRCASTRATVVDVECLCVCCCVLLQCRSGRWSSLTTRKVRATLSGSACAVKRP